MRADGAWYETLDAVPPKVAQARKLLASMFAPPAETLRALHIERCMRVLPHDQDTGGFFIAVLRRSETPAVPPPAASGASEAVKAEPPPADATADGADSSAEVDVSLQSWPTAPPAAADAAAVGAAERVSKSVRPGDWTCPKCGLNVFASKANCFRCGTAKSEAAAAQLSAAKETGTGNGALEGGHVDVGADADADADAGAGGDGTGEALSLIHI